MAIVLDGIAFGLQLAMLAVGLSLMFGLGGVLNLAHGQFAALSAVLAASGIAAGLRVWPALLLAVGAAAALAWVVDATLLRAAYRLHGEARVLLSLLLTLGLAFTIDGLLVTFHPFTQFSLDAGQPSVVLLGVTMRGGVLVASGVSLVVLVASGLALKYTLTGKAIRSVVDDEEGAQLCGIDPSRLRTIAFVVAGSMAGLVAVTQGLTAPVGATSGFDFTVLALIVTVVGGLGRVSGAMVAGLLLGVVHALASYHLGAFVTYVVLLLTAVAVILLRPGGILVRGAG